MRERLLLQKNKANYELLGFWTHIIPDMKFFLLSQVLTGANQVRKTRATTVIIGL